MGIIVCLCVSIPVPMSSPALPQPIQVTPLPPVMSSGIPGQLSPGINLPPVPIIPGTAPVSTVAVPASSAVVPAARQGTPPPSSAANKNSSTPSAMDQAMAATLAAISIPTPPGKTGNLIVRCEVLIAAL
jgi:hypothetical protein